MQKTALLPALLGFFLLTAIVPVFSQSETFQMRPVACDLSQPWEIAYGPDNYLWVTEALGYRVSRINPVDGSKHVLVDLSERKDFPDNLDPFPQGGLMGLALHPQLLTGKPYVYLAYVYHFDSCAADNHGCYFKTKLVRFTYDIAGDSLKNETTIIDTLPGSNDHNGGRLAIGPVNGTNFLFYGIGDMAAGHLSNRERTHHGQEIDHYEGKILRFNLEPDGDPIAADRWVPNDNPYDAGDTKSAVWTLGHRNPQGLVFGANGILYEAEHGPYSDDEINVILPQRNYGHPLVTGFADGNYNGSAVGAGSTVPIIVDEQANAAAIGPSYKDPIKSLFQVNQATVSTIYQNDKNGTPPFDNYYLSWPTAAPSGIDYYGSDAIPGWKNSILVAALKKAVVYRIQLSPDGQSAATDTIAYFKGLGRFRDIAISPDGQKIYVSTDTMGVVQGPPGVAVVPPNRGCILEFTYQASSAVRPDVLEKAVQVYPNPASQSLRLDLTALPAGPVWLRAYDPLGAQIIDQQWDALPGPMNVDISSWPAGRYLVTVQGTGEKSAYQVSKKVVVQRN